VGEMAWHDIDVNRDRRERRPAMRLSGATAAEADRRGVNRIDVTLAATRFLAVAWVVLAGKETTVEDVILEFIRTEYLDEDEAEEMDLDARTTEHSRGKIVIIRKPCICNFSSWNCYILENCTFVIRIICKTSRCCIFSIKSYLNSRFIV
jgi:excinuclease UvrABC ATPase subunit